MTDPIGKFEEWFEEARAHAAISDPTVMCVATADKKGKPAARMLLLKGVDARGFVFYTNTESRKGDELKENPQAALCFYWEPIFKQVRVEGKVEPVSREEADAYFATRPRDSRIGAWASAQSRPMESPDALINAMRRERDRFEGKDVPRPEYWSGWRLVPDRIEFWKQGDFRLHERELFVRKGVRWEMSRLYP